MVLAPEHPLVADLVTGDQSEEVVAYRTRAAAQSDTERQSDAWAKTGVFTGSYATNPVTGNDIPVWIVDYVMMGYGTGAIMAVPCGDQCDFEFARGFGLQSPPPAAPDRVVHRARQRGSRTPPPGRRRTSATPRT